MDHWGKGQLKHDSLSTISLNFDSTQKQFHRVITYYFRCNTTCLHPCHKVLHLLLVTEI